MFTGIVEEVGTVKALEREGSLSRLQVIAPKIASYLKLGKSVSISGVCLSVVNVEQELLTFEMMPETIQRTNLPFLKPRDKVNLERALRADGRMDGHFVAGHIDGLGTISKKQAQAGNVVIKIEAPEQILRYIVMKGSVAVEGVSLTVSAQEANSFSVSLISYTLNNTILGLKKEGNLVNIECDILAKYIDRLTSQTKQPSASRVSLGLLQEHGFI
ncbi:MAG: riboflavin synthase [Omnitrophica bacterium]|nr:riboflavin synthase [Candidatus Omnitrophota bacterium]